MTKISKAAKAVSNMDTVHVLGTKSALDGLKLSAAEKAHIKAQLDKNGALASCPTGKVQRFYHLVSKKSLASELERSRSNGAKVSAALTTLEREQLQVVMHGHQGVHGLALAEGICLAAYRFVRYKSDKKKKDKELRTIQIVHSGTSAAEVKELDIICRSTCIARDLVNEPLSFLTAEQLAMEAQKLGKAAGFKVEVLNKAKIKALKMGGLLAVNLGSPDPPTFSILEWKPRNAKNKAPILLVGKGVVYDTGGLSLKATPNSMDQMKCDMAGAAAMIGTIHAVASQKLPIHVIALIPATDNRPGGNAFVPGDVITMHSGLTVEVLNTDAEGRLLLADALSYGERFKPELVIDAATLTGAAVRAIGTQGIVAMGTASEKDFKTMEAAGDQVHERIARMPFWEEYDKEIESDIADIKNLGGPYAGAITAGKFLARFVKSPFIHLDIAGPAFLTSADAYRPKGGTGTAVRLLYQFLRTRAGK